MSSRKDGDIIAKNIRYKLMPALKISKIKDLQKILGTNQHSLNTWLNHGSIPSGKYLIKMLRLMRDAGLDPMELFND